MLGGATGSPEAITRVPLASERATEYVVNSLWVLSLGLVMGPALKSGTFDANGRLNVVWNRNRYTTSSPAPPVLLMLIRYSTSSAKLLKLGPAAGCSSPM